ncbi:hypothetical protein OPV22_019666 [Ensete ventricosum]|uniref:Plantacyanin n=1 Tax=Ensete ventricosum TaxID=4639 RepID=A0AAV8Q865_ENSVE|nr:hypothetical protein OPV22_019666 [Ensete ventricosum]
MGKKLDVLLGRKSRQMSKLKTLLGLTLSRLAVLRNRRQVRCNQARTDVAQLLQLGQVDRALLRVEHVIREQNMVDVFVMSEHYCRLLIERSVLLDHKECQEELREAISSLCFAASRCVELPELDKARGIFSSRYGKELVSAAVELRNNCRVNPKMIQKLSTRQPSLEIRQRVTKEIAAETGINLLEFHDPYSSSSSEVAGGDPPVNLVQEQQLESDENLSMRTPRKYEDVASAAKDAFEAAAFAAAAARAAVELCRSESQGRGSDPDDESGGRSRTEEVVEEPKAAAGVENSGDQIRSSDSEEEIEAGQHDLLGEDGFKEKYVKQFRRPPSSNEEPSPGVEEQGRRRLLRHASLRDDGRGNERSNPPHETKKEAPFRSSSTLTPTPIKCLSPLSNELHKRALHTSTALLLGRSRSWLLSSGVVMAQGRGSVVALGLALLCLLLHSEVAEAATYVVGGNSGWTFNVAGWPRGKSFRAGDVLLFNYNPSVHNVVAVRAAGYNSCSAPRGSRVSTSGKDRITLARGTNYFICSFAGHCQSGMKIAVTAA